jgi:hypothetical protein
VADGGSMNNSKTLKPTHTFLTALLLAPLTGDRVPIFPGADSGIAENGKRRFAHFEEYRRWARVMHERGAKGLYLFNLFQHPQDGPVWNGVLSGGLAPL